MNLAEFDKLSKEKQDIELKEKGTTKEKYKKKMIENEKTQERNKNIMILNGRDLIDKFLLNRETGHRSF